MCKKLVLLSLLPFLCYAEENATSSEDVKLLNESVDELLKENGYDTNWSFSGILNGSAVMLHQSIPTDDTATASLDGDIYIRYDNKWNDLGFGLEIGNKVKSGLLKQGSAIVDTSFIYIESDKYGKFKFGYTNTAADTFSITYASVLTGYTGPDSGYLSSFYNQTSGSIISTGFDRDDGKSLKVVWLSPIVSGWSMGLSYSPNSRDGHLFKENRNKVEKDYSPKQNYADKDSYSKHNFTGGIAYEWGDPEAFNAKISVAGWYARGKSDVSNVRNVCGYNVGALLGYGKYSLALGYTDNGRSLLPSHFVEPSEKAGFCSGADAGKIYNIGIGYKGEKVELSAGYFHAVKKFASKQRSNSNIATFAAQYNFNRAFSAYVEYDNIRTRTCERSIETEKVVDGFAYGNNHANMFVIGSKINL